MRDDATGHDWWHTDRVVRLSLRIASEEGADSFVVELAALLHDLADWKLVGGDEKAGPRVARQWLEGLGVEGPTVVHVCDIVGSVSFKGAGVPTPMRSVEGMAVQDADRLDALGAIGIARTFAYGGHAGHPIYDPESEPTPHATFDEYRESKGSTVAHFYEKLLLLKDRMNTPTGKRIAAERHAFMEQFLDRFFREWKEG